MKIEQTVEVPAPIEQVWALVNDVERVAPCMPGAELTRMVDDRTFEGTVAVKLGPIALKFKGTVVREQVDEAAHSAVLAASGKDVRGGSTARATVLTTLEDAGAGTTRMHVSSDVQLSGKLASYGRGVLNDVSARLFGQFADCLRDTLATGPAPAASPPAASAPAAPTVPPVPGGGAGEPAPVTSQAPVRPATAAQAVGIGSLVKAVVAGRLRALWQRGRGRLRARRR